MFAAEQIEPGLALTIIDHIFTEKDEDGASYQTLINDYYSKDETIKLIEKWLKEAGLKKEKITEIRQIVDDTETTAKMEQNRDIIENQLKVKGIPTIILDGKKHTGLWKTAE
jgi:cell division inhibitor SulA